MAKIKLQDPINAAIEATPIPQEGRGYLGLSQLGHECDRHLYYVLHNAPRDPVYPRTIRIWERGDWEEARVIKDLESIGCTLLDTQTTVFLNTKSFGDKVKGHSDGIVVGGPLGDTKHLLEIKTAADTSWKKFQSQGIKRANIQYWKQAQLYANLLKLDKILFCVVNKNDESRYFEIFDTEPGVVVNAEIKAAEIIIAEEPPKRIGGIDFWTCKMCSFKSHCHG
jgi:hypothetical protein